MKKNTKEILNATILTALFLGAGMIASTSLCNFIKKNKETKATLKEGVVLSNDLTNVHIDTNNDGKFSTSDGDLLLKIELNNTSRPALKKAFNIETGDKLLIELSTPKSKQITFDNIKAINDKQISENFISNKNKDILAKKINKKERS